MERYGSGTSKLLGSTGQQVKSGMDLVPARWRGNAEQLVVKVWMRYQEAGRYVPGTGIARQ